MVTEPMSFAIFCILQYIEYGVKSQDPPNPPSTSSAVASNALGTTSVAASSAGAAVSTVSTSTPFTQPTHGAISRPATSAAVSSRVSNVHYVTHRRLSVTDPFLGDADG